MDYVEKINLENKRKLQGLLKELPKFCADFFRYLDTRNTASRTRLSYGYDIRLFFEFIQEKNPIYGKIPMHEIPLDVLDEMTPVDIEEYLSYLSYYEKKDGQAVTNGEKGKSRKLSAIRTMYNYYFKKEFIKTNAPSMVETPKKHKENTLTSSPTHSDTRIPVPSSSVRIATSRYFVFWWEASCFAVRELPFSTVEIKSATSSLSKRIIFSLCFLGVSTIELWENSHA